jgi:hypothetical protein
MNDVLCNPDDVLFSIRANEDFQNYKEKVVCILEIKNLNSENKYKKQYTQKKDNIDFVGVMELLHDPVPCMYPHCVFRVWINEEIVTIDNRKDTIDKYKEIRTRLKDELASMIWKKQVSQLDNPT